MMISRMNPCARTENQQLQVNTFTMKQARSVAQQVSVETLTLDTYFVIS